MLSPLVAAELPAALFTLDPADPVLALVELSSLAAGLHFGHLQRSRWRLIRARGRLSVAAGPMRPLGRLFLQRGGRGQRTAQRLRFIQLCNGPALGGRLGADRCRRRGALCGGWSDGGRCRCRYRCWFWCRCRRWYRHRLLARGAGCGAAGHTVILLRRAAPGMGRGVQRLVCWRRLLVAGRWRFWRLFIGSSRCMVGQLEPVAATDAKADADNENAQEKHQTRQPFVGFLAGHLVVRCFRCLLPGLLSCQRGSADAGCGRRWRRRNQPDAIGALVLGGGQRLAAQRAMGRRLRVFQLAILALHGAGYLAIGLAARRQLSAVCSQARDIPCFAPPLFRLAAAF
jgi:hypothetical protein